MEVWVCGRVGYDGVGRGIERLVQHGWVGVGLPSSGLAVY